MASLAVTEHADLARTGPGGRELCLVHLLRNVHGLACWYVDSRIALLEARFPFAAPPHADAYAVLFPALHLFDAGQAEIRFDARYLALPIRRDERAMRQMLQRALPLTVLPYRRDRLLVQQVRQVLAAHPAGTHNADSVAALLATSARTLHRQLREEGATLQALKDEVRRERAQDLLYRTRQPHQAGGGGGGVSQREEFHPRLPAMDGHGAGRIPQPHAALNNTARPGRASHPPPAGRAPEQVNCYYLYSK